jgi:hypothetical protein
MFKKKYIDINYITKTDEVVDMIDIEVDTPDNTFILANGVITHNSIGVINQLTVDASIDNARGTFKKKNPGDQKSGILSPSTATIPYIGSCDGARAMLACSQTKQAIPIIGKEQPLVQTGYETIMTSMLSENYISKCPEDGKVVKIDQERLDRVGWRKIQEIHGAVRNGIIGIDDALASAGTLSVQDLIKERLDWVLADARKRGLSPTVLQACQTCTFLRTFDPAQQMAKMGLWLADIDEPFEDEGDGSVSEEYKVRGTPIRLQATECSYCVKRNIGLALGKPLSRSRGLAYGEACTFYEEAI